MLAKTRDESRQASCSSDGFVGVEVRGETFDDARPLVSPNAGQGFSKRRVWPVHGLFQVRDRLFVVTLLIAIVALVISVVALATRSVAPTSLAVGPVSGVYVNGHSGVPHYYVTLENRGNGVVRGSMDYLYQDGQTSVIFTFNGWSEKFGSHGTTGSLTLSTIKVKGFAAVSNGASMVPSTISAQYSAKQLVFGECSVYLKVLSLAACNFTLNDSGLL